MQPTINDVSADNLRVSAHFGAINKCNTIRQYQKQIRKGREHYSTDRCKITHTVKLSTRDYDLFTENLLEDVEWLGGKGGHESDAIGVPQEGDFFEWTQAQQETFRRTCYRLVVAVSADERNTIYIDPQGYQYARYVGL